MTLDLVANITRVGRTKRMVMGALAAVAVAGLLLWLDPLVAGRWWRLALVPLIAFSALCVFQAQEQT